ncbi:type VI secretion system membrane subunit TssM [Roseomonas marmotae]|uniref:Type VI secretion system membrane subunit TssM n=1 Tax=Roseomonas marmotae TaxID=2768161 RepID=A0ABS3K8D3_9PROT|nr:type VI secretion system membrane subunit TssM [Roseomonas marmotae]MBO1073695.1 type VI secretion system membrane subunit TssM [Roseomonas marmotae]QTI78663.1 type VI secretion system membrane subunit TssM [Roseomonas marmotae]
MQNLKTTLLPKLSFILLGMAVLAALILVWGPAVSIWGTAPLESVAGRVVAVSLLPVGLSAILMVRQQINFAVQNRITDALGGLGQAGKAVPAEDAAVRQEMQLVTQRFRAALQVLRKRRFAGAGGRRWLYQLPWYVVIGPPGSGKTTAITESGLTFPLAGHFGKAALNGIGGTRNCDWWFTDDAVLIDTAGRYMTQDSAADQDKAAWLGFLRLLRRHRRRQPLNGIIVAIGIDALTAAPEALRQEHARRVRQRISEVYGELGLRLPIYVLLTKFDLVAGFVEFFDDLGQEGRGAVWGITFPHEEPEPEDGRVADFGSEFDALVRRLDERLPERLQREGDMQRRAMMFGFPQQVASLRGLVQQFLSETFAPNSFEDPLLLRGVYFVSGTQAGTPLDRVTEALARSFALTSRPPAAFAGQRRSYFLRQLLRDVIFPEAGLVMHNPAAARRQARLRLALMGAAGLLLIAGGALEAMGFFRNARLVEAVRTEAAGFTTQAQALTLERVDSDDPRPVLPLLARLRGLSVGLARDAGAGGGLLLGLDQHAKLAAEAGVAYRRALNAILLPRLLLRLEAVLTRQQDDPVALHEPFKVYLMLGQQGPLRPQVVRGWMLADWQAAFPGEDQADTLQALQQHLDTLLEGPLTSIGLNGPLIEQVRATLQKASLPRLVFNGILASPEAARLPAWRLADFAGPGAEAALRRRSGQPLVAGIPGLFTQAGFRETFLRLLPAMAQAQAEDRWVVIPPQADADTGPAARAATVRQLRQDATAIYLQEFSLHWDRLLGDIAVVPVRDIGEVLRVLNILAAPTSPIRLLLASVARETTLGLPPAEPGTTPAQPAMLPAADTPEGLAARYTAERFRSLRQLVEVPPDSQAGAQAPIDDAIRDLDRLYRSLSDLQGGTSDPARQSAQAAAALSQIERRAAGLPPPIDQWILGIGRTGADFSASDARQQLGELWRAGPGQACQRLTQGRYPFIPGTAAEIPLGDFGRLFGRDGSIDSFFSDNLKGLVETGRSPWAPRSGGPGELRLSRPALAQFERAAAIRDSLFQDGGSRPSFGFSLALIQADPAIQAVVVELDGRRLEYRPGDAEARRIRWPGAEGSGAAAITVLGPQGAVAVASERGGWALFRLLDRAVLRSQGPDSLELRVTAGPHQAAFTLTTDGAMNPFVRGLLAGFRCPQAL